MIIIYIVVVIALLVTSYISYSLDFNDAVTSINKKIVKLYEENKNK